MFFFRPTHHMMHHPILHHHHHHNLGYVIGGVGPAPKHHIMHNGSMLTATVGGSPLPVFFSALGGAALITIANIVQSRREAGAVAVAPGEDLLERCTESLNQLSDGESLSIPGRRSGSILTNTALRAQKPSSLAEVYLTLSINTKLVKKRLKLHETRPGKGTLLLANW